MVGWLERRIKRLQVDPAMLEEYLDGVVDGWRRLRREGWGHLQARVGLAAGYWGFDIVCLLLVMLAFHAGREPRTRSIIAYAVANVVGTFSPTPGGLGAVEGVMIALLVGFGMPSAAAVAVVLVYRLINFWLPIPAGLATYAERALAVDARSPAPARTGSSPTRLWYCLPRSGPPGQRAADPGGTPSRRRSVHIIVFAVIVLALYLLLPKLVDTQQTVKYVSQRELRAPRRRPSSLEIAALARLRQPLPLHPARARHPHAPARGARRSR